MFPRKFYTVEKVYNLNAIINDVLEWNWLTDDEREILVYKKDWMPTSKIAYRLKLSPSAVLTKMRLAGIRYYKEVHNANVDIVNTKWRVEVVSITQEILDLINSEADKWTAECDIVKILTKLSYWLEAAWNIISWRHMPVSFFEWIDPSNKTALTIWYLKLKTGKSPEQLKSLLQDYSMSEIIAGRELYHVDRANIRATYNNGSSSII